MATDPRRFDAPETVIRDTRNDLEDFQSTILARLAGLKFPIPVTATTDILTPYTGQIVSNTTDNMLYRYTGSAWLAILGMGGDTAATRHAARYESTNAQSIANSTDVKCQFPTAVKTSNDVTASGTSNTDFLINRTGWWLLTAAQRYAGNAGGGERNLSLITGTNVGSLTSRLTNASVFPAAGVGPLAIATVEPITSGTSICVGTWQNCGVALAFESIWGTNNHVSLTWLGPL